MRITSLTVSDVPILRVIARDTFIETFSEANKAEDMDRYLANGSQKISSLGSSATLIRSSTLPR